MKYLLVSFFLFYLNPSESAEIKVRKMLRDGELERSHVLVTNLSEKVVLDCQSFIQGLRIGVYEDAYTFILDPQDCDDLSLRIRTSLRKLRNHCIDVEEDIRSDRSCD